MANDTSNDIFAQLESEFEDWMDDEDDDELLDIVELDTDSLFELLIDTKGELRGMGQLLNPISQDARDLHSIVYSCKLELSRRGIFQ